MTQVSKDQIVPYHVLSVTMATIVAASVVAITTRTVDHKMASVSAALVTMETHVKNVSIRIIWFL